MEHYSDTQIVDELNGQGPGDPDIHGHYPGQEPEQSECELCNPKHATPSVYKIQPPKPDYPESDNWAGSPDQGWA